MAGMLPGVESARRRRVHKTSELLDSSSSITPKSSRRSSNFCLYAPSSYESPHLSSMQRDVKARQILSDEELDETAREAKQRLDKKLNAHWKSQKTRISKKCQQQTHTEVSGPRKVVSERFSWAEKLRWRFSEGAECAVCLETFKSRQTLMELACNHRFHSSCLLPCRFCRSEEPQSTSPHVLIFIYKQN